MSIQNECLCSRQRLADGHVPVRTRQRVSRVGRVLGWAVEVVNLLD